MATGWSMQLAKQAGEYLVAGELCRNRYLAATFNGNVPDYDIVAISESGQTFTVQVKTILRGAFQIDVGRFLDVKGPDGPEGVQEVLGRLALRDESIWVFVFLEDGQPPAYFVTDARQVQDLVLEGYTWVLNKFSGRRPRNPYSRHHTLSVRDLERFRDDWGLIERRLAAARAERSSHAPHG